MRLERGSGGKFAIGAAVALALALTPGAAGQVSVPPPLAAVPSGGRYIEPSFSFSKTQTNVPYGQAVNSRGELQTLLLDAYEPNDDSEEFRPAVVWVHGGFFARGSKSDVEFLHDLTRRGYVTVSINYRIRPEQEVSIPALTNDLTLAPAFIETIRDAQHDALAAIRWVRANAADLRVDPGRVVIAGHSAGGLTTFGSIFNHEDVGGSGNPGWVSRPTAGLAGAGAYGSGVTGRAPLPGDAPILVMHGTNDTTVPMATSTAPCTQTLAVGNICEMRIYPGAGHGLPDADRGLTSTSFLYRHMISAERVPTRLSDLAASTQDEEVIVTGRLATEAGAPIADARILGRGETGGPVEATTSGDGTFTLGVQAPDAGTPFSVKLRYEGHYTGLSAQAPTSNALAPKPLAPAHATITQPATSLSLDASASGQITDAIPMKATLTSGGLALANKRVTFAIGSRSAEATTDPDGVAEATLTPSAPAGLAEIVATFEGDGTYAGSRAASPFDVLLETAVLAYGGETRATGETVNASVRLVEDDGPPIAGAPVTFEINGEQTTVLTDGGGVGRASLAVPDHGRSQEVVVTYPGDDSYVPAETSATVTWGGKAN